MPLRVIGQEENERNARNADLFKAIVRSCYNVTDVIIGHHIVYILQDRRADGFTYQVVEELPSADCLIFDHEAARLLWGNAWRQNLVALALEPTATRDALLARLFKERNEQ